MRLKLFGVLVRKERWGLSRRGWLIVLAATVAAFCLLLFGIYPFLAVTHRVNSNVLVVEGWIHEYAIQAAVDEVESLDVLINNAGLALYDDLSDRGALERHLAVNLFGTYAMIQAFLPLLTRSGGAIVNNLSVNALAPLPLIPAYSISKAAAFNLTQSLRALLMHRGVSVHAILTGPVDTDMTRGLDIPKSSPESVARAIFEGVGKGEEDIFPDPMSKSVADSWRDGAAKALERQYALLLAQAGHVPAQQEAS